MDTGNSQDVSFGEVWVCSGQSNMEFNMSGILDAEHQSDVSSEYTQVGRRNQRNSSLL